MVLFSLLACSDPSPAPCQDGCLSFDGQALRLTFQGEERWALLPTELQLGFVEAYQDNLSYDPFWPTPDVRFVAVRRADATVTADTAQLRLDLGPEGQGLLQAQREPDGSWTFDLWPPPERALAVVRVSGKIDPAERLYGLGETFDAVEQRGQVRPLQIEVDPEIESFYNEAHVPIPLLIGTKGWLWFVESRHPMVVDAAAARPDRVTWAVGLGPDGADGLRWRLTAGPAPAELLASYYAWTGWPALPSPWALGVLLWRDENLDQAQVEADIEEIRRLDLPTSGIWIDRPYATGVNTFDFEAARFPDPAGMVARAHAAGLRVGLWHTPYLDPEEAADLHQEALDAGFFPPSAPLPLNNWSEPVDPSNPEAVAWWQAQLESYRQLGIEGYKLDYGEDVIVGASGGRLGWSFADGTDERTMHKRFALLYHQMYAPMLPPDGGFLLCRAGTWGDQAVASLIWPGDLDAGLSRHREVIATEDGPLVSVGGLHAAVMGGLSLGASGYPLFASDTGGYRRSPPDAETFERWFQHTAFTPVMQVGNSASLQPWEAFPGADEGLLDRYRAMAREHLQLFPYLWTELAAVYTRGRSPLLPSGLAHPELTDPPQENYLLGEDLLVAPATDRGQVEVEVELPAGRWVDWFTQEVLEGPGRRTVPAPRDQVRVWLRESGLIPRLEPDVDTLAPASDPDVRSWVNDPGGLVWRVFPGRVANTYTVFDGSGAALTADAGGWSLALSPGTTFAPRAVVEVIGQPAPPQVLVDGEPVEVEPWPNGFRVEVAVPATLAWGDAGGP
jgi:alpha-D-xyloside xylohydrolase